MEINNIATLSYPIGAQSPPSNNGTISNTAGNASKSSTDMQNQPGTPAAQDLSISSNIAYIQQQMNDILSDYPPLLPAGKPYRMDWILSIRNVQDKIAKSSLPSEMKKTLSGPPLTDQATDSDISTAIAGLNNLKNAASQPVAAASDASQQGPSINIVA